MMTFVVVFEYSIVFEAHNELTFPFLDTLLNTIYSYIFKWKLSIFNGPFF